jgi:hypothetical protein
MTIELSEDQALVLFELLSRYGEGDARRLVIGEAAERNVLWALTAALERQLVPPFQTNYEELLSAARARVEAQHGSW